MGDVHGQLDVDDREGYVPPPGDTGAETAAVNVRPRRPSSRNVVPSGSRHKSVSS
ncbi:hypothetical protein Rrhod_0980 [Rhodococcus rhodnii LMG 5362]|uniref:Uncharacterized protein n=1 Tax=Rhodococcus rhodnii LMG 5362 TaxID=1273125 RepID=R7WQR8_9NOCA|nr:hypothetical protein Rrhod_0980 [Rhodococcus rhodnii LMG 5362]